MHTAWTRPSPGEPLLVGLLIDVSASMLTSINNRAGRKQNRLESFRDAFENLVERAKGYSAGEGSRFAASLVQLFAYGFGFGNILASWLGEKRGVRDLLELPGAKTSTVGIDHIADHWEKYREHLVKIAFTALGATPMAEGLREVRDRLKKERKRKLAGPPILFMLSDGEPTDAKAAEVAKIAEELKDAGTLIVACYVTDTDITEPRHLYGKPQRKWPGGARLMFDVASEIPPDSPFFHYLREFSWKVEPKARLFAQINQSEILSEFLNLVLSPLSESAGVATPAPPKAVATGRDRVFVSYCHKDERWLERLRVHLRPLEREGRIDLWSDKRLKPGAKWRKEIGSAIESASVAILLVSADFLASEFIASSELPQLLAKAEEDGLLVVPVIVGPSQFSRIPALSQFQAMNDPARPLVGLRKIEQEEVLSEIADAVRERAGE